ncbi:MAG: hypothetical protein ACFFFB_23050 [Candidatus Heimdallarchaeota archaeon]
MSPVGIVLYEIDESFGPNILAEYYLSQTSKITPEILKDFIESHIDKEFLNASVRKNDLRYFSSKIDAKSIQKENLYIGFILKEEEDLVSMKSIIKQIADEIIQDFSKDRAQMEEILKKELNSIFSLMEKLKEPTLIKDTINEKTKKMIDDGKLQEARELIALGEEIPEKLSDEVVNAEQLLKEKMYKKAKKSFLNAAELAGTIQEREIQAFLESKAEQIDKFPELIKERDQMLKEVEKFIALLHQNKLHLYHELLKPVNRLINISNTFEEQSLSETLSNISTDLKRADQLAKELFNLDKKFKDFFENFHRNS